MQIDAFMGITLAILLLFIGKAIVARLEVLRRYSIPEALVGGVLGAAIVFALHLATGITIAFDSGARDFLLLYFFAGIGLNSDLRTLAAGGWPFVLLTVLAVVFIVLQNLAGMGLAAAFGMDPQAGLMVGSVALTGGVGTTVAWSQHFSEVLGIHNAKELGLAANTVGLIAACVIGGPIAAFLMRGRRVQPSLATDLEVGVLEQEEPRAQLDYNGFLLAVFWLNCALVLGQGITQLIALSPIRLPGFVGCLLAGIILRAGADLLAPGGGMRFWNFRDMQPALALISDICLGLFLTMALMGLRLWELAPVLGFITVAMLVQITMVVAYVLLVVFRVMGRDYDATVMCAGFGGIALGSTATAIVNMTAVTRRFGAARQAMIVVTLVCGFSIDLANSVIIGLLAR